MTLCKLCARRPAQKDGCCPGCRLKALTKRKFPFTPEWDEMLRRGYREARTKADISDVISHMARVTGYKRYLIGFQAKRLGLVFIRQRAWTAEEIEQLREMAGTMYVRRIAQKLRRSDLSVKCKLHELGVRNEMFDSYSVVQLSQVFGVNHQKVDRWIAKGWLSVDADKRVPEAAVVRFVRNHLDEIELRRVDEPWLKGVLRANFSGRREAA